MVTNIILIYTALSVIWVLYMAYLMFYSKRSITTREGYKDILYLYGWEEVLVWVFPLSIATAILYYRVKAGEPPKQVLLGCWAVLLERAQDIKDWLVSKRR